MKKIIPIIVLITLMLSQCSELTQILEKVNIKKPTAEISGITLQNLSIEDADLLFDIKIKNPNPVGVKFAGFDYDLILAENSFLKGDDNSKLDIEANGTGSIQFPLTLNFSDLYATYKNLKDQDEIDYTLNLGLEVDLPVLGTVRIPISKSDVLPTLKIPNIKLEGINIKKLNLTSADFLVKIDVGNPNKWSLNMNKLNYNLIINDKTWALGEITEQLNLEGKNVNSIEIPFTLKYLDVGASVYGMLKNNQSFKYKLEGNADVSSSIKYLKNFAFPFEKDGEINFTR